MKKMMRTGDSAPAGRSEAMEPAHEGRAARILAGVLPSLILAACAYGAHPSHTVVTSPEETPATARFLLRPLAVDPAVAGDRLGEASASMSLREVRAYESGCRMVEAPAGVTLGALRQELGSAYDVEPNHV